MNRQLDADKVQEQLLQEIVGCYNCQPWEDSEPVWLGEHCPIADLLMDLNIPDNEWENMVDGLSCPRCQTSLHDPWEEVEIKSQYEKRVEEILARAQSTELTDKLHSFSAFLERYPYLGLKDPGQVGPAIIRDVKNWPASSLQPKYWYRARRINEESRIYHSDEMGAPDPEKVYVKEGRYNHTGQSFLYLANTPETAFQEIRQSNENLCAMQKFKAKKIIKVLDLRQDYDHIDPEANLLAIALIFSDSLHNRPKRTTSWKPEYFVPRFVADCARLKGYDGIWFSSAVSPLGENLVVFPQKIDVFKPYRKCKPFHYREVRQRRRLSSSHFRNLLNSVNDRFSDPKPKKLTQF